MTELITLSKNDLGALVESLPVDKRAAFAKAARAACKHLRDSKANYAKAYEVASAMVENWWRLGLELERLDLERGGRPSKTSPQGDQLTLASLGINKNQSSRCQNLAEKSKAELAEWLESKYDEEKYYLPTLRPASEVHVSNNSGEQEWYTPPEYIAAARKALGEIDLDPASSAKAQEVVSAKAYYTVEDDGLIREWKGRVWMNPPYSAGLVDKFMRKLLEELDDGNVSAAVVLTNNSTDTAWFQDAAVVAAAICLVGGRIRYLDESLEPVQSPLQGQVLLYFGRAVKRFAAAYDDFGITWERV